MHSTRRSSWLSTLALVMACNDDPHALPGQGTDDVVLPAVTDDDASQGEDGDQAGDDAGQSGETTGERDAAVDLDGGEPAYDAEADAADSDVADTDAGEPDAASPDASVPAPIAIAGRWHSNFGGVEEISSSVWVSYGAVAVVRYDNETRVTILQNAADDAFNPSKFSKVVWTAPAADGFYYCTLAYGQDSADDAASSSEQADASAPDDGGCNGFPWTRLSPTIEVEGRWHGNFGGVTSIDSDTWGSSPIVRYDNTANLAITQNSATASYNPGKFNRLVWTEPTAGTFYYCTIDFGLDTAAAALASTKVADASDPAKGGCGGFSWTQYGPVLEIEGSYLLAGAPLAISSDRWGERRIARYDNAANRAVVRNEDGVRFDALTWAERDGVLYVCTSASAQPSAAEAESAGAAAVVVPTDLTSGCAGAAFTRLDDAP